MMRRIRLFDYKALLVYYICTVCKDANFGGKISVIRKVEEPLLRCRQQVRKYITSGRELQGRIAWESRYKWMRREQRDAVCNEKRFEEPTQIAAFKA